MTNTKKYKIMQKIFMVNKYLLCAYMKVSCLIILCENGSPKENKEYFNDILDNLNLELLYNTFDWIDCFHNARCCSINDPHGNLKMFYDEQLKEHMKKLGIMGKNKWKNKWNR